MQNNGFAVAAGGASVVAGVDRSPVDVRSLGLCSSSQTVVERLQTQSLQHFSDRPPLLRVLLPTKGRQSR